MFRFRHILINYLFLLFNTTCHSLLLPPARTIKSHNIINHHHRITNVKSPRTPPPSQTTTSLHLSTPGWILTSILGGNIGTPIVAKATQSWYPKIALPKWTPPNRVFAPIWLTLYSLMGYAASRVSQAVGLHSVAMKLALLHYVLNVSWAPIFFGMKRLRLGHVMNVALVLTLFPVMYLFYQVRPLYGVLLLPYLMWLFLATALSFEVCRLNPTYKGYNNAMFQADLYALQVEAAARVGLNDYKP